MTTCFCTYISDDLYHSYGTDKLVKSAKYFYPEIPFVVYGSEEMKRMNMPIESMHSHFILESMRSYDQVIYLDADSMIVGKMDELFEMLKDGCMVCVRNNNDFGKSGIDQPLEQKKVSIDTYLNAGLIAVNSKNAGSVIYDWWLVTYKLGEMLPFGSQTVLNALAEGWRVIVDAIEAPVYYGVSALSGTETHWDSWKEITVNNGELILNNKKVKVLHHGGGFKPDKLGFDMFTDEVRARLEEIVG